MHEWLLELINSALALVLLHRKTPLLVVLDEMWFVGTDCKSALSGTVVEDEYNLTKIVSRMRAPNKSGGDTPKP